MGEHITVDNIVSIKSYHVLLIVLCYDYLGYILQHIYLMQNVCHSIQYHIKPYTRDHIFSISKLLYLNATIFSCQFRYHNSLNYMYI